MKKLLKTKRIDGVDPILSGKIASLEGDKDFAGWVKGAWDARIESCLAGKTDSVTDKVGFFRGSQRNLVGWLGISFDYKR